MAFLFLLATIPPASLRLIPVAVIPSCMVSEAAAHHVWTNFWDLRCRGIPPTESQESQGCSFFSQRFFFMKMDKSDSGQERHSVPPSLVRHQMCNKRKSQQEVLVPLSFPNSHFPQPCQGNSSYEQQTLNNQWTGTLICAFKITLFKFFLVLRQISLDLASFHSVLSSALKL